MGTVFPMRRIVSTCGTRRIERPLFQFDHNRNTRNTPQQQSPGHGHRSHPRPPPAARAADAVRKPHTISRRRNPSRISRPITTATRETRPQQQPLGHGHHSQPQLPQPHEPVTLYGSRIPSVDGALPEGDITTGSKRTLRQRKSTAPIVPEPGGSAPSAYDKTSQIDKTSQSPRP
jgi:hypothetical protein